MSFDITQLLAGGSALVIFWVTALSLAITFVVTPLAIRFIRQTLGQDRTILENGIPARAKILSVRQTGLMLNRQPRVEFQLEVHPSFGMPYRAQAKAVIALVSIPQFQAGVEVPVKIHPMDMTKVALVSRGQAFPSGSLRRTRIFDVPVTLVR
jgi:hypothetical protein